MSICQENLNFGVNNQPVFAPKTLKETYEQDYEILLSLCLKNCFFTKQWAFENWLTLVL